MDDPYFHDKFQCEPVNLQYDYRTHSGSLILVDDHVTDMSGAIAVFTIIDPECVSIQTYSGSNRKRDTLYIRRGSKWRAIPHNLINTSDTKINNQPKE